MHDLVLISLVKPLEEYCMGGAVRVQIRPEHLEREPGRRRSKNPRARRYKFGRGRAAEGSSQRTGSSEP